MNAKIGSVSHTWLGILAMALLALGLLALGAAAGPLSAQDNGSYGYIRTLEGPATLMQRSGDRDAAEINQPLLAGDRLIVPERSRAEIVLADRNIVRVDGGTELQLERLAGSPDSNDLATVLRLTEGNLQLIVVDDSLGQNLPRIDTQSATIYVKYYGNYRITADRDGWSEVVVRRGKAEVVTDRGSAEVHADERAVIDAQYANVNVQPANGYDTLERWAQHLDSDFSSGTTYVDDNLRYAAAPLNQYGSWVSYNNQRYWRPHVDAGWRPYWHGRWQYTPAGLLWVAYEPWGWVPYHYGTWDYLPAYGWAWQPGYVWAPAWVYWYWGPTYTSWCPVGYYTHYYGQRYGGHGFRSGVYGWAGGSWDHWDRWNWIRNDHIGRHDQDRHAVPIDELRGRMREAPRGLITTDTQGLTPDTWRDQGRVARVLGEKPNRPNRGQELPDVTPFIDRKPELPPAVVRTVADEKPLRPVDGTPLRPSTMGRRPAAPGDAGNGRVAVIDRNDHNNKPQQPVGEKPQPRVRITDEQPGGREVGGTTRQPGRIGRPAPGSDGGAPRPEANGRTARTDRTDPSDSRDRTVRSVGGDRPEGRPSDEKPARRVTPDEPASTRGAERPSSPSRSSSPAGEPEERRTVRRPDPADDNGRKEEGARGTEGEKPRPDVRSRRPDPADDGSNRSNRMEGYPMPNREERPGSGRSSVQSYDRPEGTRETPSTRRVEPSRPATPVYVPSYRQPDRPETSRRSEPTERPRVEPSAARPSERPESAPQREASPSSRSGGDSRGGYSGGNRGGDGDGGGRARATRPPRDHN